MNRLLNLKKLKSQNNIYNNNSKKFRKEKFKISNKYISNSEELKEKNNNQQLNDDTPLGSTFAYNKKYIANDGSLNNNRNLTDNQNHKFRVSLLSACPNSNNNFFVPYVSLHSPLSNFDLIKNNLNNNNIRQKIGTAFEKRRRI